MPSLSSRAARRSRPFSEAVTPVASAMASKTTHRAAPLARMRPPSVDAVMTRLRPAIAALNLPAIEKISEEQEGNAFQVLIATLLSAQTKDAVTLEASTRLFEAAPDAAAVSRLSVARIERLIYPVSFYRNKARHVKAASRLLLDRFAGRVPTTMEELLTLPGVGRKTANLVLIVAHRSADNICVDTHVHRISNRLGWVETNTPEATEHASRGVAQEVVGRSQPVSGDVGATRVPPAVSALPRLRHLVPLSAPGCWTGRQVSRAGIICEFARSPWGRAASCERIRTCLVWPPSRSRSSGSV